MKKFLISLAFLLVVASGASAQVYFQATMQNSNNVLIFKIRPINGNITTRFSAIELFVRVPTGAAPFNFGARTVDGAFAGMAFTLRGPNEYGTEPGFNNYVFEWIGGATAVPASATMYMQNVEYELFRVPLEGAAANVNIQLVHNTNPGQFPTYINISNNLGGSMSCIDNLGNTIGSAFYGPGFTTAAAPNTFINHILALAGVPVPVKFTSFSAIKKDNNALLNWTVENETPSTDRYEIERSIDGIVFDKIITLARDNSANTSKVYNNTDLNLSATKRSGLIYYRIKQVDLDGRYVYSDIRFVRTGDNGGISIFPNPANDYTNLSIDATGNGLAVIDLLNADGKQLSTTSMQVQKGTNIKRIPTNNLPAGSYIMRIKLDNDVQIIKLIKL